MMSFTEMMRLVSVPLPANQICDFTVRISPADKIKSARCLFLFTALMVSYQPYPVMSLQHRTSFLSLEDKDGSHLQVHALCEEDYNADFALASESAKEPTAGGGVLQNNDGPPLLSKIFRYTSTPTLILDHSMSIVELSDSPCRFLWEDSRFLAAHDHRVNRASCRSCTQLPNPLRCSARGLLHERSPNY
jgi:hypothetical protein